MGFGVCKPDNDLCGCTLCPDDFSREQRDRQETDTDRSLSHLDYDGSPGTFTWLSTCNEGIRKVIGKKTVEEYPNIIGKAQSGNDVLMNEKDTKTVYGVIDRAEKIY